MDPNEYGNDIEEETEVEDIQNNQIPVPLPLPEEEEEYVNTIEEEEYVNSIEEVVYSQESYDEDFGEEESEMEGERSIVAVIEPVKEPENTESQPEKGSPTKSTVPEPEEVGEGEGANVDLGLDLDTYDEEYGEDEDDEEKKIKIKPIEKKEEVAKKLIDFQLVRRKKRKALEKNKIPREEMEKELIREKVRQTKARYLSLKLRNMELPKAFQIPKKGMEIDPGVRKALRDSVDEAINEVYMKQEWDGARTILGVRKIENAYFKDIETLNVVVKDICHTVEVRSLRTKLLTNEFFDITEKNMFLMAEEIDFLGGIFNQSKKGEDRKPVTVRRIYAKDLIGDYQSKKYDHHTLQLIQRLEKRLSKKYERELKWSKLFAEKVDDSYEAPEDIAAIECSKENLGDYKLKSCDEYTGEKSSTCRKRQKIIDIKEKIHAKVKKFNDSLIDLRELKYDVLRECQEISLEIIEVQKSLPESARQIIPPIYEFDPDEEPEKFFEITKEDIDKRVELMVKEAGINENNSVKTPVEGDGAKVATEQVLLYDKNMKPPQEAQVLAMKDLPKIDGVNMATFKARAAFYEPKSNLARERMKKRLKFYLTKQSKLFEKLNILIASFEKRVVELLVERSEVALDLKMMSIRFLVYIKELEVFKDFDLIEKKVLERFKAQQAETATVKEKLDRVKRRLDRSKEDYDKIGDIVSELEKEVGFIISEKPKFSDYLWKVYRKKIRLENDDEEETFLSNESSSDSEDSHSTSSDSNSELYKLPRMKLDPNICPEHLEKAFFDKIVLLRGKRLELEVELAAQKSVVDKIQYNYNNVEGVYLKHAGRLNNIGQEVQVLQRAKQVKMNQLLSVIIIRAYQIMCLDESKANKTMNLTDKIKFCFPSPLSEIVLLPRDRIPNLDKRTDIVKKETSIEKQKQRKARKMLSRLKQELNKLESLVRQHNTQALGDMTSKFGKIIDLDEMTTYIINLDIMDALINLELERNQHHRERQKIKDQIEDIRSFLTQTTRENSILNLLIAMIVERERNVDYFLHKQRLKDNDEFIINDNENESKDDLDPEEIFSDEDLYEEVFFLEEILMRQFTRIDMLRMLAAAYKTKGCIPRIMPLCLVNNVFEKLHHRRELDRLKLCAMLRHGAPTEVLWCGDNMTERLMQSESQIPRYDEETLGEYDEEEAARRAEEDKNFLRRLRKEEKAEQKRKSLRANSDRESDGFVTADEEIMEELETVDEQDPPIDEVLENEVQL